MPAGGHFAALEKPDLLVNDIKKFLRSFRYDPYDERGGQFTHLRILISFSSILKNTSSPTFKYIVCIIP